MKLEGNINYYVKFACMGEGRGGVTLNSISILVMTSLVKHRKKQV